MASESTRIHRLQVSAEGNSFNTKYEILNVSCSDLVSDFEAVFKYFQQNKTEVDDITKLGFNGPAQLYHALLHLSESNIDRAKQCATDAMSKNPRCLFGKMVLNYCMENEKRSAKLFYPNIALQHLASAIKFEDLFHKIWRYHGVNLNLIVYGCSIVEKLAPMKLAKYLTSIILVEPDGNLLENAVSTLIANADARLEIPMYVSQTELWDAEILHGTRNNVLQSAMSPRKKQLQKKQRKKRGSSFDSVRCGIDTLLVIPFRFSMLDPDERERVIDFATRRKFKILIIDFETITSNSPKGNGPQRMCKVLDAFENGVRSTNLSVKDEASNDMVNWCLDSMDQSELGMCKGNNNSRSGVLQEFENTNFQGKFAQHRYMEPENLARIGLSTPNHDVEHWGSLTMPFFSV